MKIMARGLRRGNVRMETNFFNILSRAFTVSPPHPQFEYYI